MSEVITDKLTGRATAGNVTITSEGGSATMQLQQGLAKAWAQIDGTGTTVVDASLNVSSITDDGTGEPWPNLTNAFSAANGYAVTGATQPSTDWNDTVTWIASSASQLKLYTGSDGTLIDLDPVGVAAFGDLA